MQNRLRLAMLIAISFGLLAAYGIFSFLRQQRLEAENFRSSMQDIVVAAKEVPAGTPLTTELVKATAYLKASIPQGAFSSLQQVTGKIARAPLAVGEPILPSRLTDKSGLTVLLTPGYRAIAVRVNEFIGVSGFITPNDRVDVIALVTPPTATNESAKQISKIVLQNKRVLSVAQTTVDERKDGKPQVANSITLELTPEETEKLSLASIEGQIVLALRAAQDEKTVHTDGSTTRDLLDLATPPPPPVPVVAPPPPLTRYRVEVYAGNKRSEFEF